MGTTTRDDSSCHVQFLADYTAKSGFNLLARHGLVERLINQGLVAALPGLGLEQCDEMAGNEHQVVHPPRGLGGDARVEQFNYPPVGTPQFAVRCAAPDLFR